MNPNPDLIEIFGYYVSRYLIAGVLALLIVAFLWVNGFFRYCFLVMDDCLKDHTTGKYTINNVFRFLAGFSVLWVWVTTSYNVTVKPALSLSGTKPTYDELLIILGFVAAAEVAKKFSPKSNMIQ